MSDEFAILNGEIESWPSKDEMSQVLKAANLSVEVGRYAIRIMDFEHFVFRDFGSDIGSPCITADAESTEELIKQANLVSAALTIAGIRHRFEVYDSEEELVEYLNHNWPKDW